MDYSTGLCKFGESCCMNNGYCNEHYSIPVKGGNICSCLSHRYIGQYCEIGKSLFISSLFNKE